MSLESEERAQCIAHLSAMLMEMQRLAGLLANASHGRAYDKVRELNELLHLVRQQLTDIETDESAGAPLGIERRKTPRSKFGELR